MQKPQCQGCSQFQQCQGEEAKPETYHTVYISDYATLHRDAIEYTKTPEGKEEYQERANVERINMALNGDWGWLIQINPAVDMAFFQK